MPIPFPGMDPYLEDPDEWEGLHTRLIVTFGDLLLPQVRPKYGVRVERRMYIDYKNDEESRQIRPDVALVRSEARTGSVRPARPGPTVEPVVLEAEMTMPSREAVIQIVRRPGRKIVTVVELLSPANKRRGGPGRAAYLAKRGETLQTDAHLVEIDLLRDGERPPFRSALPPGDYYAAVHRAAGRPRAEVYAMRLRDPLAPLPIPLEAGDPDAWLDLRRALEAAYERGGYEDEIDYRADPAPPLAEGDRAWADALLRAAGKR